MKCKFKISQNGDANCKITILCYVCCIMLSLDFKRSWAYTYLMHYVQIISDYILAVNVPPLKWHYLSNESWHYQNVGYQDIRPVSPASIMSLAYEVMHPSWGAPIRRSGSLVIYPSGHAPIHPDMYPSHWTLYTCKVKFTLCQVYCDVHRTVMMIRHQFRSVHFPTEMCRYR